MSLRFSTRLSGFVLSAIVLVGCAYGLWTTLPTANHVDDARSVTTTHLSARYDDLMQQRQALIANQTKAHLTVASPDEIDAALGTIKLAMELGQPRQASLDEASLASRLIAWRAQLAKVPAPVVVAAPAAPQPLTTTRHLQNLPIIMYHQTPSDFEQQLQTLQARGYTTVTLSQALAAWHGAGSLPAKPIVLTFDDGYANQMDAFALLKRYNMKATFYIITGGPASNWCIGAGRHYNDPNQPPQGCGDAYLSWDQIRELDASGLITIGGHTIDHLDLAQQTTEVQQHQIADGKAMIEDELGHSITDFAYPYGSYNGTSIQLARAAGYRTAVTTVPGVAQDPASPYTLTRLREVYDLP